MKLLMNHASPYARLIRVLLIETELDKKTELVFVDPWSASNELLAANPAVKIPALIVDESTQLIESSCIADYLIHRSGRTDLSPLADPLVPKRLQILGLGRAAVDCAFGSVVQRRFAPNSPLGERWLGRLTAIAERLDPLCASASTPASCDLADLTVAVAYEYVDFRLPEIAWREVAPRLAERIAMLGERPSLRSTRPA